MLAVLNACARFTEEISNIKWESEYSFGKWLSRLQNQPDDKQEVIVNRCLTRLNLYGANLERANLERANLERANLERANLERANLERANLDGANLDGANLRGAILDGAILDGVMMDDDLRRQLESTDERR